MNECQDSIPRYTNTNFEDSYLKSVQDKALMGQESQNY